MCLKLIRGSKLQNDIVLAYFSIHKSCHFDIFIQSDSFKFFVYWLATFDIFILNIFLKVSILRDVYTEHRAERAQIISEVISKNGENNIQNWYPLRRQGGPGVIFHVKLRLKYSLQGCQRFLRNVKINSEGMIV